MIPAKTSVPIVYQIFPHYRAGVNEELMRSVNFNYIFVADLQDTTNSGIELWQPPGKAVLVASRSVTVLKNFLFQDKALLVPFWRGSKQIVFFGDAYYVTTWIAAVLARLMGKRVWFWSHGWTTPDKGLKRFVRRSFYHLADGLMLFGHHAKKIAVREGFSPDQVHVIYNSLDYPAQVLVRKSISPQSIAELRSALFPAPERPVLICTGRLIPMRRLDLLMEALTILKVEGREMNLLLVGDGPMRKALENQARKKGLTVRFYGSCYNEQTLGKLFMLADLSVMAGRVGLAAVHSLTYGTPVMIHDDPNDQGPEAEAIVPGFNGAYFTHNDSFALARSLKTWFASNKDRELTRTRCYAVIEKFYNPQNQAARIENALNGHPPDDSDWDAFVQKNACPA